jgi:hypothetical protein
MDSGEREVMETGSQRDTRVGKGRFDLIPATVEMRLARHYENGGRKYRERNWEMGQPLLRYYDSARRHMAEWQMGYNDEDHLAAALWNIACLMHTIEMIKHGHLPADLDDRPEYFTDGSDWLEIMPEKEESEDYKSLLSFEKAQELVERWQEVYKNIDKNYANYPPKPDE